jgi:NRPS condensation-like uncharacterized protein
MLLSRRKRYLSGSDWVINTLDYMMKITTCSGNMSQIVLMLNAPLDENDVRRQLRLFVKQFPVLEGYLARDFKLTPFWKIPASAERDISINITHTEDLTSADALFPLLVKNANSVFRDKKEHLAFHLFTGRRQSALAMTFDHRMFDARGAESFLYLFQKSLDTKVPSGDIIFSSSMALTKWKQKFMAGRNVNRRIIALSKSTPESLPMQPGHDKGCKYRLLAFTDLETSAIFDNAYREAGYLLESPYFLAIITQTMHELFANISADGMSYLIPVTMDLRTGKDPLQEVFFNHVSYLFYQIPVQQAEDLRGLIAMFKQQMYDQVKSGFPKDLAEASLLTRIVPLGLFGKMLHIPLKGKVATFAFSHLGKSSYQSTSFMQSSIDNLFHMPRVPVPPGLGFFSNYYNNRLNLVISYLDGLLTDEQVLMIESGIRKRFGVSAS